jgi:hypothetical protein
MKELNNLTSEHVIRTTREKALNNITTFMINSSERKDINSSIQTNYKSFYINNSITGNSYNERIPRQKTEIHNILSGKNLNTSYIFFIFY